MLYEVITTVRKEDFLALVPDRLLHGRMAGLKSFAPPITLPNFDVIAAWHQRVDKSPSHLWLRSRLVAVADRLSKDV